jgi:anti-anti-sigma regulatory factor
MATSTQPIHSGALFSIPEMMKPHHARELRTGVRQALEQGESHITVDCESWNQLDLSMLSSLVQCASACREWGASFEVANMSGKIRADVRALRLDQRLGLPE